MSKPIDLTNIIDLQVHNTTPVSLITRLDWQKEHIKNIAVVIEWENKDEENTQQEHVTCHWNQMDKKDLLWLKTHLAKDVENTLIEARDRTKCGE